MSSNFDTPLKIYFSYFIITFFKITFVPSTNVNFQSNNVFVNVISDAPVFGEYVTSMFVSLSISYGKTKTAELVN